MKVMNFSNNIFVGSQCCEHSSRIKDFVKLINNYNLFMLRHNKVGHEAELLQSVSSFRK